MTTRALCLVGLAVFGCTAGPDQPSSFRGTSLILQSHVTAPPAEARVIAGTLEQVPYCAPGTLAPGGSPVTESPEYSGWFDALTPFDPAAGTARFAFSSGQGLSCKGGTDRLRFFRPRVAFGRDGNAVASETLWAAPEQHVAYSTGPATFSPFGLTGPPLTLPAGYSLIRRACGSPLAISVEGLDRVIEFRRFGARPVGPPENRRPTLEEYERRFLEGCGIRPPAEDLGVRVGLDRGSKLAWSPDGATIYYLVAVPGRDLSSGHNLRALPSQGGQVVELARDLHGLSLQVPASGDIFVRGVEKPYLRGRVQGGGVAEFQMVPGDNVSPDGRWIVTRHREGLVLHDLTTGIEQAVEGGQFPSFSPDGRRLAFERMVSDTMTEPVVVLTLETGSRVLLRGSSPVWLADGRLRTLTSFEAVTMFSPDLMSSQSFRFTKDTKQSIVPLALQYLAVGDQLMKLEALAEGHVVTVQTKLGLASQGYGTVGMVLREPNTDSLRTLLPADVLPLHDVQVLPGDAFLIWSRKCLGLYETVCSFRLHHFTLRTGMEQVLAISDEPAEMAVSPDRRKVAISTGRGIFVKDLPAAAP